MIQMIDLFLFYKKTERKKTEKSTICVFIFL